MRMRWTCLALLMLGMTLTASPGLVMPLPAGADDAPFPSQPFVMDGAVNRVDADRERVTFLGDNGKPYTLDTSQSEITLMDGNRAGLTADLSPGMRVHVSGKLLSSSIAEVDHLRVLDNALPVRPHPARPAAPPTSSPASPLGPDIELRGTVESIDTRRGAFVVRVKDKVGTHTRTILLADNTDVSGMALPDPDEFPVKPGDRVTVAGSLEPDKSVLAGILSRSRDVALPVSSAPRRAPFLLGRVSSASNRYTSRDIKIRLEETNREIKIRVPRGIPILETGKPISVHDLAADDLVRVTGAYDGDDFQASRIEVVRLAGDDGAAPDVTGRRGL